MLLIPINESYSTTREFSERSGIPRHLLDGKLTRLGIKHSSYVSFANQEYLQEIYIKEGKEQFILAFSKMNYQEV